tara:strand:+ start:1253 stop:1714 length:462 start_codon:yes stop_codon:yes gene_type:complete
MPVVNASSFLLLKDTDVIGHSNNTSISLQLDLPETTTKDSGGFAEYLACIRSGSITASGFTAYNDTLNFDEFASLVITKSKQTFFFKEPSNPKLIYRGEGFVSSANETANHESITEFDIEITLTDVITVSGDQRTWENVFEQWEALAEQWQNI